MLDTCVLQHMHTKNGGWEGRVVFGSPSRTRISREANRPQQAHFVLDFWVRCAKVSPAARTLGPTISSQSLGCQGRLCVACCT
jgi:hypothetical protein